MITSFAIMKSILFQHNAKTAGHFICSYLRSFDDINIVNQSLDLHLPVFDERVAPLFENDSIINMTCIRHPIDRFVSIYNFLLIRQLTNQLKEHEEERDFDLNIFLDHSDVYQYKYYGKTVEEAINTIKKFDYIIEFNNLSEDLNYFTTNENLSTDKYFDFNRKVNATNYLINSFTVDNIKLITSKLTCDIYFYREVKEHLKRKNNIAINND